MGFTKLVKWLLLLVDASGGALRFPAVIGERLGLAMSQRLVNGLEFASGVQAWLKVRVGDAESEGAILSSTLVERSSKGLLIGGAGLIEALEVRLQDVLQG